MIKLFTHVKYLFVKDNTTNTVVNILEVIRSRITSTVRLAVIDPSRAES